MNTQRSSLPEQAIQTITGSSGSFAISTADTPNQTQSVTYPPTLKFQALAQDRPFFQR